MNEIERKGLDVAQLDRTAERGCSIPGCKHENHPAIFYFHSRCHTESSTVTVSYTRGSGVLEITCGMCGKLICHVKVDTNTGLALPTHPDPSFLEKPLEWFHGKMCKLRFVEGGGGEMMWVRCDGESGADDEEFTGTLMNQPVVVKRLKWGHVVMFSRRDIVAMGGADA